MKNIKTHPLLRRRVMIMIRHRAGTHTITLPPKSTLVIRRIRRAMKSQKKLGYNNFLRGILSEEWDRVQQQFEKTKTKENSGKFLLHHWSRVVSKISIECCVKIWRYWCEIVHLKREGNVDDVLRSKLLAYVLSLQDTPCLWRSHDRHLIERNIFFCQKSKRATLLGWKARLNVALKLAEDSANEVGQDSFFFWVFQICEVCYMGARTRLVCLHIRAAEKCLNRVEIVGRKVTLHMRLNFVNASNQMCALFIIKNFRCSIKGPGVHVFPPMLYHVLPRSIK